MRRRRGGSAACSGACRFGGFASACALLLVWLFAAGAHAGPPRVSFSLQEHDTPSTLCPGEPRAVRLRLHNDGALAWQPGENDKIAYHWLDAAGEAVVFEGERTELPRSIAPGDDLEVTARVIAPQSAGRYRLVWAMVREGVRWYPPGASPVQVEVVGRGPALAIETEGVEPPATWGAGERAAVPVAIVNAGCAAWSPALGDALTYRFHDASTGALVVEEGLRTPLPETAPGQRIVLTAEIQAPIGAGTYVLELAAVREHLGWFFAAGEAARPRVTIGPSPLRWAYALPEGLPPLSAGDRVDVPLQLTNVGETSWSHVAGDRLAYRVRHPDGRVVVEDGLRTRLPRSVAPGETVTVRARLRAPDAAGAYLVHWEMVREGKRWYGPPQEGPVAVAASVGPPRLAWSLVAADPPARMWAGRASSMAVTLRNVGTEAWSPEHGDRLAYHWRDHEGEIVVGEGERTGLPGRVEPGATVTVTMAITGPPQPGRHRLEIDLVREHVMWLGGPREGPEASFGVGVHRLADVLLLAVGLLVFVLVLVRRELTARRPSPARRRAAAVLDLLAVPLWAAVCIDLIAESFVDYGGIGMWSGARALTASGAALLVAPLVLLPRRPRAWLALAGVGVLTMLSLADLGYMHFFGSIVPLTALAAVHHLGDASETVTSLMRPEYGWLLVLPLSGVVLVAAWPRAERTPPWWRLVAFAAFAAAGSPAAMRILEATTGELGAKVFSEQNNVGRLGLVNAHVFEVSRGLVALVRGPAALTEPERARVDAFFVQRRVERGQPSPGRGAAAGMNVLLVQVEALQGWAVEARVGGEPVMPFLTDAVEQDALWFRRVYDQTAQGRTSDAEYLTLSSNHPLSVGALCFLRADNRFRTLAHATAEAGYATLSAHPYKRGFWNRAVLHPRYGFSRSLFRRELGDGPVIGWGLADEAFFERLVPELGELPSPFFAFGITLSLHHPYESFPAAFQRMDMGELSGTPVGNYLHAMHHFDDALRKMLDDLRASGLLDHTLVVVYGDHVSRLEEPPEVLALAGIDPWDPSVPTRVRTIPVFVWVPGGAARGLVGPRDRPGGQIDIGPTIVDLLGMPDALPAAVGRSLLDEGPGFVALPGGSAVTDDRMFVAQGRDIGRDGACFHAVTGAARPRSECAEIAERASAELSISRLVLDHDLQREIGAR